MTFLLIAVSLAVLAGLWTTLTHYWTGFHWFAALSVLLAFVMTILSVVFAGLELLEGVSSEAAQHERVLLRTNPPWKGAMRVVELKLTALHMASKPATS